MNIKDLTPEVLDAIEACSIWAVAPVAKEPVTNLTQWRVYKVTTPDNVSETHFMGYAGYEGRVTSAIRDFDKASKRGRSKSGRLYTLLYESGFNRDAVYVFNSWCARFPEGTEFKDITDTWE